MIDLVGRECETTTWLFSTRSKPTVLKITPVGKHVPTNTKITVEFSEPVDIKSVGDNFTVKENGTKIDGKINVVEKIATFIPNETLKNNMTYTVELNDEIKDLAGNGLDSTKTSKFSTD